jgi:hypothetical protein
MSTPAGKSSASRSGLGSQSGTKTNEDTSDPDIWSHSVGNSGNNECDELFDAAHEDSRLSLSASTPNGSVRGCDDVPLPSSSGDGLPDTQGKTAEAEQTVRLPKDLLDWIRGVEFWHERQELAAVAHHSPDLQRYADEKARTPPTHDWHTWTSEYAPWYVLLPKNRSVLSSNDWVEVKNYRPLTRPLDEGE